MNVNTVRHKRIR